MRPFNFDLWKAGEPVITRDGQEVKELTYFESRINSHKLAGIVNGEIEFWSPEGYYIAARCTCPFDLFHPEPEMWVNLYHSQNGPSPYKFDCGEIHSSKEEAEENIGYRDVYIGTYKLVKE